MTILARYVVCLFSLSFSITQKHKKPVETQPAFQFYRIVLGL
ncbi:hypothetical Protein YC6258_02711 [Gynuella sunshinyii YC6258]|uniref:Uncharacterized protein n=1 Tax=Gynuella sunshinyii YC6258 TaxID=1445510 RepID=A0A0C5VWH7_9GAMM|nr:hypothetical Protein YC6258_02711 [Gynuella sunshinyii YC6258]